MGGIGRHDVKDRKNKKIIFQKLCIKAFLGAQQVELEGLAIVLADAGDAPTEVFPFLCLEILLLTLAALCHKAFCG